jgi:hypothetical protein
MLAGGGPCSASPGGGPRVGKRRVAAIGAAVLRGRRGWESVESPSPVACPFALYGHDCAYEDRGSRAARRPRRRDGGCLLPGRGRLPRLHAAGSRASSATAVYGLLVLVGRGDAVPLLLFAAVGIRSARLSTMGFLCRTSRRANLLAPPPPPPPPPLATFAAAEPITPADSAVSPSSGRLALSRRRARRRPADTTHTNVTLRFHDGRRRRPHLSFRATARSYALTTPGALPARTARMSAARSNAATAGSTPRGERLRRQAAPTSRSASLDPGRPVRSTTRGPPRRPPTVSRGPAAGRPMPRVGLRPAARVIASRS